MSTKRNHDTGRGQPTWFERLKRKGALLRPKRPEGVAPEAAERPSRWPGYEGALTFLGAAVGGILLIAMQEDPIRRLSNLKGLTLGMTLAVGVLVNLRPGTARRIVGGLGLGLGFGASIGLYLRLGWPW